MGFRFFTFPITKSFKQKGGSGDGGSGVRADGRMGGRSWFPTALLAPVSGSAAGWPVKGEAEVTHPMAACFAHFEWKREENRAKVRGSGCGGRRWRRHGPTAVCGGSESAGSWPPTAWAGSEAERGATEGVKRQSTGNEWQGFGIIMEPD